MNEFNDCSSGIQGYLEALRILKSRKLLGSTGAPVQRDFGKGPVAVQDIPKPSILPPRLASIRASLGEFEVNMVEALIGWKRWNWSMDRQLLFSSNSTYWPVERPVQAMCHCSEMYRNTCSDWTHTCGIYSADDTPGSDGYGSVLGQVYGWGRYIRGSKGWRAQFAYPKCFYLQKGQANLIDTLKKYRVPIFIDEPLRVYDPGEDGFEVPEIGG